MINSERLQALRAQMKKDSVGAVLIRSTDRYFNEYVPKEQNQRAWLSGFDGSAGDILVTQKFATLYVDGRYTLQAAQQAPDFSVEVSPLGKSIQSLWLQAISSLKGISESAIYVDTQLVSRSLFEQICEAARHAELKVIAKANSYLSKIGYDATQKKAATILQPVGLNLCGQSSEDKFREACHFLTRHDLDALLVVPLDEIAWLCNMRGSDFPYQSTFAARAVVFKDKMLIGMESYAQSEKNSCVEFVSEDILWQQLKERSSGKKLRVGIDLSKAPEDVLARLEGFSELVFVESPLKMLKSLKNPDELLHMREAFARADNVVHKVQQWLCKQVSQGAETTEAEVGEYLRKTFFNSGALGLSFAPICAAGKHAAVIHYGTLDNKTPIKKGELFLLDVGGIYEGGYATDLTRTFLVGDENTSATLEQKFFFTTVLKGAIAGLSACFPKSATGMQLDAIVRAPIWQAGYDYAHGTGHGVGILVHESPPTVAVGSTSNFAVGQVFSIEPGLYLPEFGGIRIENLATVVDAPNRPGFFQVLPLTFAPLDKRLIDESLLTPFEKKFLAYFEEAFTWDATKMPRLPQL